MVEISKIMACFLKTIDMAAGTAFLICQYAGGNLNLHLVAVLATMAPWVWLPTPPPKNITITGNIFVLLVLTLINTEINQRAQYVHYKRINNKT